MDIQQAQSIDRVYRIFSTFMQAERDRKAWGDFHRTINERLNKTAAGWFAEKRP